METVKNINSWIYLKNHLKNETKLRLKIEKFDGLFSTDQLHNCRKYKKLRISFNEYGTQI